MPDSVEAIFHEARQRSAAERSAYIDGACGADLALRAKVEALLEADAEAASFLESVTLDPEATLEHRVGAPPPPSEQPGQELGRYKLLQKIGEGGFGSVWMAEQREPVKRRVALKIIKLGMDTKQVIARFEAERQALAMMDHPHIAKVFDAGSTETGRPYFVMEYIRGVPVLEYCDTEKLSPVERLKLFIPVCQAIQHAHQKGIIHRDIKPGNVLITLHDGVPVPKVIDFGIAKATSAELTNKTLFTEHRQMIGTPAYMSPEQAEMSGLDIDTRSDIYALGVLLYELLTGTTPFDNRSLLQAGYEQMMHIIREQEPHKPSTRLSSLGETATRMAAQRRTDAGKLGLLLRGDLDWIVMKCLEKDRSRRYDTANGLAADIQRHLDDEPVKAGPPSAGYRLSKFVKRNRVQVIAGGAIAASLVLGVLGATAGLLWALDEKQRADVAAASAEGARDQSERQRQAAEASRRAAEQQTGIAKAQLARSEEFRGFMVELLGSIEPDLEAPERSFAIRALIETAYDKVRAGDVRDVNARAEVIDLLDATATRHSWFDLQIELRRVNLDEAMRLYGRDDPRTMRAALSLVRGLVPEGRASEALRVLKDHAIELDRLLAQQAKSALQRDLIGVVADVERLHGNYEVALRGHRRGLVLAEQIGELPQVYYHQIMVSRMLWRLGRLDEALQASDVARPAFDTLTRAYGLSYGPGAGAPVPVQGPPPGSTRDFRAWVLDSWYAYRAEIMMDLARHAEALRLFGTAGEIRGQVSPDDFTSHVWEVGAGRALHALGRTEEALEQTRKARAGLLVRRAPHYLHRDAARQLIVMLCDAGRQAEHDRELAAFLKPPSMPLVIYRDGWQLPYAPSGLMGEVEKARWDQFSGDSPYEGEHCFRWRAEPGDSWVAVAWCEPANNWGDLPGGYDLSGAERLSFAARGQVGGETVRVGIGVIDTGDYPDTRRERMEVTLTSEWQDFTLPLDEADLSTVRSGFVIESELSGDTQTIYFDAIRIE
ncbi:MAG: serine/threonine-protein kinase [Planctomycetota bacterium]